MDSDAVARFEVAGQQSRGEGVQEQVLDRAFQGTRPELRVVTFASDQLFRRMTDVQTELSLVKSLLQTVKLDLDYAGQLFFIEAVKK